jgi:hypothetical protein
MFRVFERKSKGKFWLMAGGGVVALGAAAYFLLKNETVRRKLGLSRETEIVDLTSEESFPASDAPSWTSTTSLGSLH